MEENCKGHPASHHAGPLPRSRQNPTCPAPHPDPNSTGRGTDLKVNPHS
uniref:Uncharacterized protein n=2 Tax=Felidae TaxID=9681 RepID=A0A8C8WNH0_PANLE